MATRERSFDVDLTRALQEFGFGPSDDEYDSDSGEGVYQDEWDSIGLLPSWQKIQITLRNASYSFIAGTKREADTADESYDRIIELTGGPDEAAALGIKENQNIIDLTSEVHGETTDMENHLSEDDDDSAHDDDDDDDDDDEEDEEDDDDQEEDADEDELEEVGRFPTLNQLQLTLKNASEMLAMPPTFDSSALIKSPSDLLAKWGGNNPSNIGWQSFMQNFTLPSFLSEEPEDDIEPLDMNDPEIQRICRMDDLTPEDRSIGYNEEGLTGCSHYLRNCKTACPTCGKFYMCHLCHDEHEHDHQMDRTKVTRMLCLHCQRTQPPARQCRFCKEIMGDYYCPICKLWNDDPDKPIYHCDKCGICRVGRGLGIDVFHCDRCGICMSLSVQNNHKCIEHSAKSNCPICLEDLFSSRRPTVFMPCGHPIHRDCFEEYSKRYYRCPICSKSILNTSALFRMIDEEVQSEVLPPELVNKKVNIICQDCRLKSQTQFHLAGLKCETCGSYNTIQI